MCQVIRHAKWFMWLIRVEKWGKGKEIDEKKKKEMEREMWGVINILMLRVIEGEREEMGF